MNFSARVVLKTTSTTTRSHSPINSPTNARSKHQLPSKYCGTSTIDSRRTGVQAQQHRNPLSAPPPLLALEEVGADISTNQPRKEGQSRMPHTSRRKRPAQDSKRKNTPLGDGWTLISRSPAAAAAAVKDAISPSDHGKSVSSDSLHSADAAAPENSPSNSSAAHQPKIGPRLLMPDITLSDLKREYAAYQKRWKASTCREKLCSVRNGVVGDYLAASDDGIGIQQRCFWSVCVGLGSLCEEPRDRSMWQLVVWMGVCDARE